MIRALVVSALLVEPTLAAPAQRAPQGAAHDAIRRLPLEALFNGAPGKPGPPLFGDLNGDGVDEAVVPLMRGGQTIAVAVYGFDDVGLLRPMLLHEGQGLKFALEGGKLVITGPAQGGGKTGSAVMTYGWDGRALVLVDERATPTR